MITRATPVNGASGSLLRKPEAVNQVISLVRAVTELDQADGPTREPQCPVCRHDRESRAGEHGTAGHHEVWLAEHCGAASRQSFLAEACDDAVPLAQAAAE